jgi:hypothetical protein
MHALISQRMDNRPNGHGLNASPYQVCKKYFNWTFLYWKNKIKDFIG